MISATLVSLTNLLRLFRSVVTTEVVRALVSVCVTLYSLDSHEIQRACLNLIRTSVGCLSPTDLDPLLGQILGTIFSTGVQVTADFHHEETEGMATF
jgi:hypothetical protein